MIVTPEELSTLPPDIWTRLAAGEDAVHIRAGASNVLFRLLPMEGSGGTVADFFHSLATPMKSDDEELAEFERDVEEGRRMMNQPLVSPWDT